MSPFLSELYQSLNKAIEDLDSPKSADNSSKLGGQEDIQIQHLMRLMASIEELDVVEDRFSDELASFDFVELLENVIDLHGVQARRRGIELGLRVTNFPSGPVVGNPGFIRQIMVRLLQLILRHHDTGSLMMEVSVGPNIHSVRCRLAHSYGPMPEQLSSEVRSGLDSRAIETSLIQYLIDLTGGSVVAGFSEGGPEPFEFILTFGSQSPLATPPASHPLLVGLEAIVLEDNWDYGEIFKRQLTSVGMTVTVVHDEDQLRLQMAAQSARERDFDLVVMDLRMVTADDFLLVRQVRQRHDSPILMVTALDDATVIHRALNAGAQAYLQKPVKRDRLLHVVSDLMTQRSNRQIKPNQLMMHRKSVLVIDDNERVRDELDQSLRQLSCIPILASNLQDALKVIRRDLPDLILVDTQMPVHDGFETARALVDAVGTRGPLKLFGMSAEQGPHLLNKCLESGMLGLLAKPVEMEEVAKLLNASQGAIDIT